MTEATTSTLEQPLPDVTSFDAAALSPSLPTGGVDSAATGDDAERSGSTGLSALQTLRVLPSLVPKVLGVAQDKMFETVRKESEQPNLARATFEQYNIVASTVASERLREQLWPTDETPLDTDQLLALLERDQLWGLEDHFLSVRTMGQYTATRAQLDRETANREAVQDASLFSSVPLALTAGIFDLPTLIPFGATVRGVNLGARTLTVSAQTGLASLGAASVSEAGLQATQETRTLAESVESIAAASVLGLALGGAGSAIANSGGVAKTAARTKEAILGWLKDPQYNERLLKQAQDAWDGINEQILAREAAGKKPTKAQQTAKSEAFDVLRSAGERLALYQDLSLAQAGPLEWARTVGPRIAGTFSARWIDPHDFIFKRSNSVEAKRALEQIAEVPVYLNKNLKGEATAVAVTTELDQFIGGWATFRDRMLGGSLKQEAQRKAGFGDSYYAQAVKAGFKGTFREFDEAVDTAVRNGFNDPKGNSAVTTAAKDLKALILDPVAAEAKLAGIEVPDNPFGALGYMPRRYRVHAVLGEDGQGTAFKHAVTKYQYEKLVEEANAGGAQISRQKLAGLRRSAKTFSEQAFKTIVNGRIDEEGAFHSAYMTGGSPFKARVVPVPDSVLAENGWIEQSATALMEGYLRQTVPALLMSKRFRTKAGAPDPSLEQSVIPSIVREYEQLGATATSAAAREALNAEGARVIAVVRNMRDAVLHSDRFTPRTRWHEQMNGAIQLTKLYQVTRLMGNIGLASLPDVGNLVLRQGPGRFVKVVGDSFVKAVKLEGLNGSEVAEQAKRLGAAVEWASNSSVAASADLLSPLNEVSTPLTRFVHKTARAYSVSNFSVTWNDTMKRATYRASVDRVLEAAEKGFKALPQSEQTFLAHLGLDDAAVNRIGAAWRTQDAPLHDGFLRWATVADWEDKDAARLMSAALNKDIASTIIRPRVGDKALGYSGPLASLIFQFQGFLQSHALRTLTLAEQRVVASGPLGADALRVYVGAGSMVALGWLAEYLYAVARDAAMPSGREKHVKQLTDNPGQHVSRAIDRSAIGGLFSQGNAFWERFGGPGQTRAFQKAFDDTSMRVESRGRWADRDPLQQLLGPTASQVSDLIKLGVHVARNSSEGKPFVQRDARTIREMAPWQNHIILRGLFDEAERQLSSDVFGVYYRY